MTINLDLLLTEARNPASADLDVLSSIEIVRLMNAEDATVANAVAADDKHIARAIDVIVERLRAGGRLVYVGAGTSGRLGVLDASECPPTFNSPPGQVVGIIAGGPRAMTVAVEGAEDHPEEAEADLSRLSLSAKDVVVGIASSGRTPYVVGGLRYAKSVGAAGIGLACVPDSDLVAVADLMITPLVGPEVLTGSTRLKAGTATKLVLNMLSTGAMVRLGKTLGNLMIDLRATNTKLRARTNRIVRMLTGASAEEADALLDRCNSDLKTALVVARAGLSPSAARDRLVAVGGRVGDVLRERPQSTPYPTLILGIDGGGTHTVALLASIDGTTPIVLGRGEAGPSNVNATDRASAFVEIGRAVEGAFAVAGLARGPVGSVCLGLAGVGRPENQVAVTDWAKRVALANTVDVVPDVALPIALLPNGWGVAVVAGTGSSVWGLSADGRTARAGGWGPLLGDEGSAYALVLGALRLVARGADSRMRATSLTDRLLKRVRATEPSDLVRVVHGGEWDRSRLASLAPEVIRAADDGDISANSLVEHHVNELAECVAAVVRRLAIPTNAAPLALSGGLLVHAPTYRDRLLERLNAAHIRPPHVMAVSEPAEGALRRACLAMKRESTSTG
jgi:N-acetylmuramic acid 6-phosphate etherase